jgi:hypothetical protein
MEGNIGARQAAIESARRLPNIGTTYLSRPNGGHRQMVATVKMSTTAAKTEIGLEISICLLTLSRTPE